MESLLTTRDQIQARKDAEKTLTGTCTRSRMTQGKDATGAPKSTYTPFKTNVKCRVVAPALTPDISGQGKQKSNVDFTFLFSVEEYPVARTERFLFQNRVFEVTSVGIVQDFTVLLKVLAKEV